MSRLYIAEKPSLGRSIAETIGIKSKDRNKVICSNGDVVTWLYGHLIGLSEPHDYDIKLKQWREQDLPIIPEKFEKKPTGDKNAQAQLKTVLSLIKAKETTEIVNAGDAGREGQLLVDEVIEYSGTKKPVLRIWLKSLMTDAIQQAVSDMQSNTLPKYVNLSISAEARSRADWMVGLNLTRATTLRARAHGMQNTVSVGRVQSPTLAIVVARDRLIDNFKVSDYFVPGIVCDAGGARFTAAWVPKNTDTPDFDPDGRLLNKDVADKLASGHSRATVQSAEKKRKNIEAPLPHSLSTLQKVASNKFGFSAKKTLDICQGLYDEKYTTYPRSDSQYLNDDQIAEAPGIIKSLVSKFPSAGGVDLSLKHKAWNSSKVSDHFAIIPTGNVPRSLNPDQEKIYQVICESYIQLFYPAQVTETYTILLKTNTGEEHHWKASVTNTVTPGWKAVASSESEDKSLPALSGGDEVAVVGADVQSKKTKPPTRFNDGTLIEEMKSAHKYIVDKELREQLKETQGIGTEATRSSIIELLLTRKYIKREGKYLTSTDIGKEVDAVLPETLKDPGMTAMWEAYLSAIAAGDEDVSGFYQQIEEAVKAMVDTALSANYEGREVHTCPECGSVLNRLESKNKKGNFFWACTGSREHPLLSDKEGSPGEPFKAKAA